MWAAEQLQLMLRVKYSPEPWIKMCIFKMMALLDQLNSFSSIFWGYSKALKICISFQLINSFQWHLQIGGTTQPESEKVQFKVKIISRISTELATYFSFSISMDRRFMSVSLKSKLRFSLLKLTSWGMLSGASPGDYNWKKKQWGRGLWSDSNLKLQIGGERHYLQT